MKIAIVEIGHSHDECIYSQVKFIKTLEGVHLTLVCNETLKVDYQYFALADSTVFVRMRSGLKKWLDLYEVWKLCKKEKFNKIIFNTAQGKSVSHLLKFPFSKRTQCYGILHNTRKVFSSHSQKTISRKLKHYFVLNEYLEENISSLKSEKLGFSTFHPIFFPAFQDCPLEKKKNEIWVCIPGQVELKRRDYDVIFESIPQHGIAEHIKFLLLGRCQHACGDGSYIKQQIGRLGIHDHFILWDTFISLDLFHSVIRKSDYICPLIHKGKPSADLYKHQISGSYNLAAGYKKPMLIENHYHETFKDYATVTYNKESFIETVNALPKHPSDTGYTHPKWMFDFQKNLYLSVLSTCAFLKK